MSSLLPNNLALLLRFHRAFFLAILACSILPGENALAAIEVNDPLPISHTVDVRLIQTAESDGSPAATALGQASQRTAIEAAVDEIWAQAGIDVRFESEIRRFNDTFSLRGNGGERPDSDLEAIIARARNRGNILAPSDRTINLFLVDIAPGHGIESELNVKAAAQFNENGIASFVGEYLFTPLVSDGLDIIATELAQKIGHNLGLESLNDNGQNLMSLAAGGDQRLNPQQIFKAWSSYYSVFQATALPGDFNADGAVDAADYTVWRDGLGTEYQQSDYTVWRSNFGSSVSSSNTSVGAESIPEPAAFAMLLLGIAAILICRRRPTISQS